MRPLAVVAVLVALTGCSSTVPPPVAACFAAAKQLIESRTYDSTDEEFAEAERLRQLCLDEYESDPEGFTEFWLG